MVINDNDRHGSIEATIFDSESEAQAWPAAIASPLATRSTTPSQPWIQGLFAKPKDVRGILEETPAETEGADSDGMQPQVNGVHGTTVPSTSTDDDGPEDRPKERRRRRKPTAPENEA